MPQQNLPPHQSTSRQRPTGAAAAQRILTISPTTERDRSEALALAGQWSGVETAMALVGARRLSEPGRKMPQHTTIPVRYPAGTSISAIVVSLSGSPPVDEGPKFDTTPVRSPSRPVSSAARLGVHTEAPAWKSVKRNPEPASLSRFGVRLRAFVGGQFAPRSPQPQSARRQSLVRRRAAS